MIYHSVSGYWHLALNGQLFSLLSGTNIKIQIYAIRWKILTKPQLPR